MTDDLDPLVLKVRADTQGFAREVDTLSGLLEGPLAAGADRASRSMEAALSRFVRTGKFGFDDLKRTALGVLDEIAASAIRGGIGAIGGSGGGLLGPLLSIGTALLGLPGRATGGPVSPGRAFVVGERGPEVFVPTASGRVEPIAAGRGPVTINVTVNAPADASPQFMAKSGRQVARAVRQALER